MSQLPPEIRTLISKKAIQHNVDLAFLTAMVMTESVGGNSYAPRFEPQKMDDEKVQAAAREWAPKLGLSYDTEHVCLCMSWGLMQVMGYVLRLELGFRGMLPEVCKPELGLDFGVAKLKRLELLYTKKVGVVTTFSEEVVAAYNHGHPHKLDDGTWINQAYVDKVRTIYGAFGGRVA